MAGAIRDLKRRRIDHGHRIRQVHRPARIKTAVFGKPALSPEHRDTVTQSESLDLCAQGIDGARHLHTKREWQLWRVLIGAFDHQKISEIQPTGVDSHPNLTCCGFRHDHIVDFRCGIVIVDLKRLQSGLPN